jgi:hypothetical protein
VETLVQRTIINLEDNPANDVQRAGPEVPKKQVMKDECSLN